MVSACSSETHQLCNIRINLEEDNSRSLSAEPLKNYTIYYKSIYRGSDPSKAYGDMSNSSSFNKLTSSGILVSQGLWEIEAIFKESDQGDIYTPIENEPIASSGNIYINLNTQSIAVSFTSNEGYVRLTQYELRSVPNSITDASISVNAYKYNTETSSFDSTAIPLTLKQSEKLKSGVYYAVVEVKGTVSNTSKTLFTDCIGFVVRSGLTTIISGSCDKYDESVSTPTEIIVNTKDANDKVARQINAIPISIPYQIDVYARYLKEADSFMRDIVFNIINHPTFKVIIPYQGINLEHNANMILSSDIEDNSDIPERLVTGQFYRMSLTFVVDDAYLWDIRDRGVVTMSGDGLYIDVRKDDEDYIIEKISV